ncbi:Peptide G protein-coupled receptor [Fasciola hepatica]|uniref:Peptide G protein-coupled receptor n=1 Tax=Fasciola hepatica TaxID=6192 RepID=A0A4E0RFR5_FASHE|nr:Peptide G protein-coupled receptor [Fasciola hepatica]
MHEYNETNYSMNTTDRAALCGQYSVHLESFYQNYQRVHVYICLVICPIGVLANILNVVVLCQPRLRNSTNLLLSMLAVSDGLVMVVYIIFDYFFLLTPRLAHGMTLVYAELLLINIILQNLFHIFSAWIIVAIAIFRLLYIKTGVRAVVHCSVARAWIAIAIVFLFSVLLIIPFIIAHQVAERKSSVTNQTVAGTLMINNQTVTEGSEFRVSTPIGTEPLYEVNFTDNEMLKVILFWTSAILIKALPILIISSVSAALIISIRQTEKRYRSLHVHKKDRRSVAFNAVPNPTTENGSTKSGRQNKRQQPKSSLPNAYFSSGRNANQTTYMLLTIIIFYIITYLPQSALLLLNHFLGPCFNEFVYERLGDFMDFLTLINNSINFILYCGMSKQFRDTFLSLFCSNFPLSNLPIQTRSVS